VKSQSPDVQLRCLRTIKSKLDFKDVEIANSVGYTYADLSKNLVEAKKLISYVLKKKNSPEFMDSMAWVLFRMGKYKDAAEYIEKTIGFEGKYPDAVIADHAGDIYYALGNKERAGYYWRLALKIFSYDLDKNITRNKLRKLEGK
jgi:tetratricopeptide (TPR) repeat protein